MFEDDPEAINFDNYGVIYRSETYTHQKSSASLASKQPTWRDQENLVRNQRKQARRESLKASFFLSNALNDLEAV